ncbi:MAG: hypothetical protein WA957_09720 [Alteraurantiacibacter sp.]
MKHFSHFTAIDWSGAVGSHHKAIAVAVADAQGGPPVLVVREKGWRREKVLALLRDDLPPATLVGLDLGISLPFADRGAFFPGWQDSPPDARSLWRLIERICRDDPHLAASSFVDHPQASAYFRRHGGREGPQFGGGRGRFRVTEIEQAKLGCKPYSNFNLVGAAQVGKSSLTGMRMLHALRGHVPVWPVDPLSDQGSTIVEIYTSLAAIAAGRSASRAKMRSFEELNTALANLHCPPVEGHGAIDDHSSDALVTAAWLRKVAHDPALWSPRAMSEEIARTEGWTFGVP